MHIGHILVLGTPWESIVTSSASAVDPVPSKTQGYTRKIGLGPDMRLCTVTPGRLQMDQQKVLERMLILMRTGCHVS